LTVVVKRRFISGDALERAQYRNSWCDDAGPVNQGRSEQAHNDEGAATVAPASGISAKIPPSPWLSARITKRQYLTEIVMTSAHKAVARRSTLEAEP